MSTTKKKAGIFAVLGAALCFGTTGTTQQLGVPEISPVAVGAARLLCGALFLFIFGFLQRSKRGSIRLSPGELLICGAGVAIYQLTFFTAVKITGVAIATVTALGTVPTFSAIVAFLVLHEKPGRAWFIGTSITIVGIGLIGSANGVSDFKVFGVLLAAVAGLGFAIFTVVSRRALTRGAQDVWVTASSFGVAAVLTFPFLFAQNPAWILTTKGSLTVLWLGLITTSMGYVLFMFGLKRIESSLAATVVLAEPATATILAALVIGEKLVVQSYFGIATVALGILYLSRKSIN